MPWITYEAENASGNGAVISVGQQGWEASGGKSVRLNAVGQYVQFTSVAEANRLVLRYSVPDGASGTISLYVNGAHRADIPVSAAKLYEPKHDGTKTVRYYDEVDIETILRAGDTVRIQKDANDSIKDYYIDLVDLEKAPGPGVMPSDFISITDVACKAIPNDSLDDDQAIRACFEAAKRQGKAGVWFPKGIFNQSDRLKVPDGLSVKGAGIWHARLIGPKPADTDTNSRVGFIMGNNTKISDMRLTSGIDARKFTRMAVLAKDMERSAITESG